MIPSQPPNPERCLRLVVVVGRGALALTVACDDDLDIALVGVVLRQRFDMDAPTQDDVAARFGCDRATVSRRLKRLTDAFDAAISGEA